ncbi:uncharacterized protein LOC127081158 [Lathyrus oleraceus]|uniref:uncharacterized protein LOC127081158 n=1 Tax=Pisum sativum TaxID=3888 RepID=UPI0021D16D6E|nr:uncharacterized protein LOC127081158 [Pisum sativum]
MVEGCPGTFRVYDIRYLERDLVEMHLKLGELICMTPHNYAACKLCRTTLRGCHIVREELQKEIDNKLIRVDRNRNFNQVNMVEGCQGNYQIYNVRFVRGSLVEMHKSLFRLAFVPSHDYTTCEVCSINPHACSLVRQDIQGLLDVGTITVVHPINLENSVNVIIPQFNVPEPLEITFDSRSSTKSPLVIYLPGPTLYQSDKVVPYKYQATMIKDGKEVPQPSMPFVVNIANVSGVTRSGHVFTTVPPRNVETSVGKKMQVEASTVRNKPDIMEESSRANINSKFDEVLILIKKSEYKIVGQLLQTPSKIFILSLLMSSEADREALQKVLKRAYVDHDAKIDQFDSIVANITACNNLSFSHEELPVEGKDHNMALHISMNCLTDSLSGVLVDIGSSLNVILKSNLSRLTFQGAPMRSSGVIVKAFDDSRKSVIGEVDLPMTIGPHTFQITFQVMDIHASYSCLLGLPWIHEAMVVTSTLHQRLKFVRKGKLVTVCEEESLVVSHLSYFSLVDTEDEIGTQFQTLSVVDENVQENGASICSFNDARQLVKDSSTSGWGQVMSLPENKFREGLGFSPTSSKFSQQDAILCPIQETFRSGGFINPTQSETNVVIEEDPEEDAQSFVTHRMVFQNWIVVDVPTIVHVSK